MNQNTNPTLPRLHVGKGAHFGALTLFLLWAEGGAAAGLEWDLDALDVGEQRDGGQVNSLTAINLGHKPVVLLEGDLLEGGWQTRMVARSTILGPHETSSIAALCVEQGRWELDGDRGHRAAGRRVSALLRGARDCARREGRNPQAAVWHGITSRYEINAPTATNSFADHLDRVARERRQRNEPPLPANPLAAQRGVIIGIGGRVLGMELLATPTALTKRWNASSRQPASTPNVRRRRRRPVSKPVTSPPRSSARTSTWTGSPPPSSTLAADQGSLRLSGIALPGPERSIDGEFWRIVHLAAHDQGHPLLADA